MEIKLNMFRKPQFAIIYLGIAILVSLFIMTEVRGDDGVLATDTEIPFLTIVCSKLFMCYGAIRTSSGHVTTHFYIYRTPVFFSGISIIMYGILMTVFNKRVLSLQGIKFALTSIGIIAIGLLLAYFIMYLLIRD